MKLIPLLCVVCFTTTVSAQRVIVKGQLTDSLGTTLPSATVLLLNAADSSLSNFAITNAEGMFTIRNVKAGEHIIKVSFVGYRTLTRKISTGEKPELDMGRLTLLAISKELQAVEIEAEQAPVIVKKDTIEFNASSFKTRQNAVVEDLLKKLPGVEVDNEGNITAQGEQVKRVTVDGKTFFGSDPKLATRNLPADAVNKVQVFDKKSDQSAFTGIDDGQREKTINLELKEEKRQGAFGNLMAGGGTEERFQSRLSLNRFSKRRQLSVLAMANNVNDQGFSMEDYMNFSGGAQRMFSGGAVRFEFDADNSNGVPLNFGNRANGMMSSYAAGANANHEFGKKAEINGSYFFNYLDHDRDQTSERINFLPTGNFSYVENSRTRNNNENHRINFALDQKLDSMNSIKLTGNLTYNRTESQARSDSENRLPGGEVQNASSRITNAIGDNHSVNGTLLWRHKFRKKNRTFTANLQLGYTDNDRSGSLDAVNSFFGSTDSTSSVRQLNEQDVTTRAMGGTITYTEPLGKRRYLEGNYSVRQNLNVSERNVFDDDNGELAFNKMLSNSFSSDYRYQRAGLNFRTVKKSYNVVVGTSFQTTDLQGNLRASGTRIKRTFQNLLPVFRFNYDFSNTRHITLDYETSVQEPNVQQLQPVIDNSDPLNLYVGNPQLRPAYNHSWRLNFTTFDPMTFVNFFAFVDVDYTTNAIANAQSIDEKLVRLITPVNVSSNFRLYSNANVGFPVEKLKSRFSVGPSFQKQKTLAILNDQENAVDQQTLGLRFNYTYRYKEIVDLSLGSSVDYQMTNYQFEQPDQRFTNNTYSSQATFNLWKHYQLSGDFEYLVYRNEANNFKRDIPLLHLHVSRYVLKNKAGEVKLSVNNLLDRAIGINQTATINYLERQVTNSLGRYVMLSFTYALNRQLNPLDMRRGGMIRIMR